MPARNEKKLLLTFSVILAGTLSMAVFMVWWLWELNSNIVLVSKQIDKVVHIGQIKESVLEQSGLMNRYIITGNPRYLEQFRQAARANRQVITGSGFTLCVSAETHKVKPDPGNMQLHPGIYIGQDRYEPLTREGKYQ